MKSVRFGMRQVTELLGGGPKALHPAHHREPESPKKPLHKVGRHISLGRLARDLEGKGPTRIRWYSFDHECWRSPSFRRPKPCPNNHQQGAKVLRRAPWSEQQGRSAAASAEGWVALKESATTGSKRFPATAAFDAIAIRFQVGEQSAPCRTTNGLTSLDGWSLTVNHSPATGSH